MPNNAFSEAPFRIRWMLSDTLFGQDDTKIDRQVLYTRGSGEPGTRPEKWLIHQYECCMLAT